jgi:hypothetical protein
MNIYQLASAAVLSLGGVLSAGAHEYDPGDRIVLTCPATHAPRMAEVARAIKKSNYSWAAPRARREMLGMAREACASGTPSVAFVPQRDEHHAPTAKVW